MKWIAFTALLVPLFCCEMSSAQTMTMASDSKPAVLQKVGIDQKIGAMVPPDLVFNDETGRPVRLGSFFGHRPMILVLVYYRCPMLCTMVLNNLLHTACLMPQTTGKDYDILAVSFDPRDTPDVARRKKENYLREYGRPGAASGWHFLTGRQDSITQLTRDVGFRYTWDSQAQVYVHASGIIVLTPQGKISRYFFGVNYDAEDLRLALTEASGGHTGGIVDSILLYCCYYNPTTGKYNVAISRFLKAGGVALMLGLGALIGLTVRYGKRPAGPGIAARQKPARPLGWNSPDDSG